MIAASMAPTRPIPDPALAGAVQGGAKPGQRLAVAAGGRPATGTCEDRWGSMMIAARDGDDHAYDLLLRELSLWLERYFRRRLVPSAADDAAQEVLLAVHVRRYSYEAKGAFGPWIASIARHKWMDCLRRHYRDEVSDATADIAIDDHAGRVHSRLMVVDLLARLRPAQATVVHLVKIEGASIQEAATLTGQSPSLVKVNIHRAMKVLAGIMTQATPA